MLHREGFRHYRVRDHGEIARLEVGNDEMPAFLEPERRTRISVELKKLGFSFVVVDLEGYRPGGVSLG